MTAKPPEEPKTLSPELRTEALKLLRSGGYAGFKEVETLLGWDSHFSMTRREMAQRLDITEGQLKYLVNRDHMLEKQKERRIAKSNAGKITLTAYTSQKLRFSISIPANWRVISDTSDWPRLAQEHLQHVLKSKRAATRSRGSALADKSDVDRSGKVVDLRLMKLARRKYEEDKADAEKHAYLEQMATGLFQAELPRDPDAAFVEVTKLRMDRQLTAIDLYELDKHPPADVPWGSRPSKRLVVDGLSGVVYYYIMDTGDSPKELPVLFNVYLAEGLEGWILSCQCRYGDFYFKTFAKYKPIFRRIISSFTRLRAL